MAEPMYLKDGVPVFYAGQAPEHLRSRTWLSLFPRRLKPGPDQQPLAWVDTKDYGLVALFDPAAAVKMRPLPSKTRARMEREHTCPRCGQVKDYRVRTRCESCAEKDRLEADRLARYRCRGCSTVRATPYPKTSRRLCRACLAAEGVRRRTCAGCGAVRKTPYHKAGFPWKPQWCGACLASRAAEKRAELAAARLCRGEGCTTVVATWAQVRADGRGLWRWCPPCTERVEAERAENRRREAEREQAERERRRQEVAELAAWARAALADPSVVVLDTETTGLGPDARIVEISVVTASGEVVLDTLLNPGEPIPAEATAVHGITDAMVADAPTFSDLIVAITGAIDHRRVLIYNDVFDTERLRRELTLHYTGLQPDPAAAAAAWLDCMTFEDVMGPYSDWVGDWSEYHGNYRWQPLDGGHRALGDCRAVLRVLAEMGGPEAAAVPAQGGQAVLAEVV